MFQRLVFADSAALFTLAAFFTALSIFLTISWRAVRMKRAQTERFAHLPFVTATPPAGAGSAAPPAAHEPAE
jgi:hypothetical protein